MEEKMKSFKILLFTLIILFIHSVAYSQPITVNSPNGGENWIKGTTHNITWTSSGITTGTFVVWLYDGETSIGKIKVGIPCTNGAHSISWIVGNLAGGGTAYSGSNFKIKVRQASLAPKDFSDAPFTISSGGGSTESITVTSPNGGGSWMLGYKYTINWTSTNLASKVRLELVRYKGQMLGIIAENLPASGSYQWEKAGEYPGNTAPAGKYLIRARSMAKFKCFDESDAPFNLKIFIHHLKPLIPPPVIESVLPFPVDALTPGTQLFIKGKNFNYQPIEILMFGNFTDDYNSNHSPIPLTKVTLESSTKVNGFVPIFSEKGHLDQTVEIRVKNGKGSLSNPWKVKFVGRKEHKVVLRDDVVVLHCGYDGNSNVCNDIVHKDPEIIWTLCPNTFSICGYHYNKWGAYGDDKGYDKYKISLKNGWVFKSMQKVVWEKSSGNEVLNGPNPPLPVGESIWTPKIHWKVSPNDHVKYRFKIIVEGPLGTHYK